MEYALNYAKAHKMTTEEDYPYKPIDDKCKSLVVLEKGKYKITGFN